MKRTLLLAFVLAVTPAAALAKETKVSLRYTGWKCGFCAIKVEKAVANVDGVAKVSVNKDRVEVRFDDARASTDDLIAAVERVGNFKASIEKADP